MRPRHILTKEFLEEHYTRLGKSAPEICTEIGLKSSTSVFDALRKFGIKTRNLRTEAHSQRISDGLRKNNNWKGCGEISGKYLYIIKYGAKQRNIEFDLSIQYLWDLFLYQNRKCALTGIEIYFAKYATKNGMLEQTASLDRIDSSKGYIKDNVQWIHKDIQRMKMDLSEEKFLDLCQKVVKHFHNIS